VRSPPVEPSPQDDDDFWLPFTVDPLSEAARTPGPTGRCHVSSVTCWRWTARNFDTREWDQIRESVQCGLQGDGCDCVVIAHGRHHGGNGALDRESPMTVPSPW